MLRVTDARAKLLLVDDRAENLLALEAILEPLDTELVRAQSGEEALRRLLDEEFAAILLDVQMPGMDGFQTAEMIKRRERTKHVPILFLTAISKDAEHIFRGYGAGAVDYLMKPFDPLILRAKVAVFIELWQTTVEIRQRDALLAEQELAAVERESEVRYRSLADAVPQIVWTTDADGKTLFYNERWYEYTGRKRGAEDDPATVIHPDDVEAMLERWHAARTSGGPFETEYRFRRADGTFRWHLGRAVCQRDEGGRIIGWVGTATDIEDRKLAEERQRFIAEAGWVLGSSLDYQQTLADVARLAVPRIADWCAVDILVDGRLERLVLEHVDPLKVALARELTEPMLRASGTLADSSREPMLVREVREEHFEPFRFDARQREIAKVLAPHSWVWVPLVARDEVLGLIRLTRAETERPYDESDVVLAQELARHAAAAIDNARLYMEAERRGRAARALEAVGDGVVLVDREGTIRLWNTAATTITGISEADALGRPIEDVVPGWNEIAPLIPVAGRPGEPVRAEAVPVELGGRELWISGSGVGFEEGTVYAFRDLTEERALEELKAEFVATVSHELRTPLAAIYGSAQTIRRTDIELDPEIHEQLLGVIATESDRLGTIVSDLLLAGRLDADRLPVKVEQCDPVELAASVVESARTHLPDGVELELQVPEQVPAVVADPSQLHQVLVNLVDNAIKYSPAGGPVALSVLNGDGAIRFAISDTGLGIPASEHRRIFEKFYRLDPDMTRGIGGTGLGLYISRELVRRMSGRIWVESALGKGSTFIVELPAGAGSR
ncbi:MAG: hybrid sensor histidine kinase/response regulator [Gaiellaceae bacterium]